MLRRVILSVITTIVLLAAGAGLFILMMVTKREPESIEPERPALSVTAIRLEPRDVVVPMRAFGTAEAERTAQIEAEISGEVIERPEEVRVGRAVEAGQLLVRIDDRDYEARLEQARSRLAAERATLRRLDVEEQSQRQMVATANEELAVAEREYARVLELFEDEVSNPRELDAARLAVQRARLALQRLETDLALVPTRREQLEATCKLREAEVALAELNVERCTIVAPFDGRVARLDVELGEQVRPGRTLLVLLDPRHIEVPVELPVSWRGNVRVDAPTRLMLESNPQAVWSGRVARVGPSADQSLRTFPVYVEVDNEKQLSPLMPGMFVRARIDGPLLTDAMLVPRGAVRDNRVFVCNEGEALRRDVQVRRHVLDQTAVSGLEPGEIVITSNLDSLYDGAPVIPVLEGTAPTPALAADDPAAAASTGETPAETP
jgi:multidrug resistance efflux pump